MAVAGINTAAVPPRIRQTISRNKAAETNQEKVQNITPTPTNVSVTLSGAADVQVMLTLLSVMINVVCQASESCSS